MKILYLLIFALTISINLHAVTWSGLVIIQSNTTVTNLELENATIIINPGVILTVTGKLEVESGFSTILLSQTSSLVVNGNVEIQNPGALNIVAGSNTNVIFNSKLENTGTLTVIMGAADDPAFGFFIIGGKLEQKGSGSIIIGDGATMIVNDKMELTGANANTVTIEPGGNLFVNGEVEIKNSGALIVDGLGIFQDNVIAPGDEDFTTSLQPSQIPGPLVFINGSLGCIDWDGPLTALGDPSCLPSLPLPVELLSFVARVAVPAIELSWSTATELNNDFFTLERSADGINFEVIATVAGMGTTNETSHYEHTDENPLLGMAYYRLSQTDFDGTHEVLGVRAVNFIPAGTSFSIFPNPLRDSRLLLQAAGLSSGREATFRITDLTGRTVYELSFFPDLEAINQEVEIASPLRRGFYLAELHQSDHRFTQKLVVE